ncbi:MAG: carbohydrate ABC transporter permease [bacterium]|nr:carbohydrate ABC transporter permease [bacterium]
MNLRYFITKVIGRLVLVLISIVFLVPIFWMFTTSIKDMSEVMTYPPIWWPNPPKWHNYIEAVNYIPFGRYTLNTIIITIGNIAGVLFSAPLVAYSISRIRWRGRNILFMLILSTVLIPFPVIMIPVFIVFARLGWINTFRPLIIPAFFGGGAFNIFLLRQFFMTIPEELSDAARIDGASEFGIYSRIMLPLIKPILIVISLFTFLGAWNDFMGPLIYLQDEAKYTLSLGLQMYRSTNYVEWPLLMAAATIVVIPTIIAFYFTQNTIVESVTLTGLKG